MKADVTRASSGTASWGSAIVEVARNLRTRLDEEYGGTIPSGGLESTRGIEGMPEAAQRYAMHAFGAQFAEVRVEADTGEVRVPHMVGVFDAGRIINVKTARSQLLGGMSWGLEEDTVMDPRFGHYVNHNLTEYHVAVNADVGDIDVAWIDEHDPHVNELGAKGIGELGIVGTAAAIANAVHRATGIRIRDLQIRPDKLLR